MKLRKLTADKSVKFVSKDNILQSEFYPSESSPKAKTASPIQKQHKNFSGKIKTSLKTSQEQISK